MRWIKYIAPIIFGLMMMTVISCQIEVKKIEPIHLYLRDTEKIPFTAAVYLNPEMINFSTNLKGADPFGGVISLGDAISEGTKTVFSELFREVFFIYTLDKTAIPKGVKFLVIPGIEKIDQYIEYRTVVVGIKWTIKDLSGKILYRNSFFCERKYGNVAHFNMHSRVCEAYSKALEKQFMNVYKNLSTNKWWE
jgi:hypothetical protein